MDAAVPVPAELLEDRARRAVFWSYDPQVPSFRHRLRPVADELERRGWECAVERFPKGRYHRRLGERRAAVEAADLLVLAKMNLAFGEPRRLAGWAAKLALDVDDAIYLRQPKRPGAEADVSCLRLARFGRTAAACHLVTAGNTRLAHAARRFTRSVEVVPTTVEIAAAPPWPTDRRGHTLVWIGLPNNLGYLDPLRPALARLARRHPDLVLRVVSSAWPDWDDVPVERVEWSEAGEEAALASAGVGLMPLADDAWARGKCSFKLLQYMAQGLPCVASPVGTNREVVVEGETGFLASTPEEWERALTALLEDADLRRRLGDAGFAHARAGWERRAHVERHADLYEALTADGSTPPPWLS